MDFTKRFNQLLANEKTNQTELAKKLCVTMQAVTNLKNGNSYPSLELLCKIAKYFDVTTDYLLGLTDF